MLTKLIKYLPFIFFTFYFFVVSAQQTNQSTNDLMLCKMENNEQIALRVQAIGCDYYESDSLYIYKWNDRFYIRHENKTRILSHQLYDEFIQFEKSLHNLTPSTYYSTSHEFYSISSKDEVLYFFNIGQTWRGYRELKKLLLLTK